MSVFKFYNKDCLDVLREMESESVDLIITSPPYCMGKAYEDPDNDIDTFKNIHLRIINEIYRVVKKGGNVCWQVGYHVHDGVVVPLDYIIYDLFNGYSINNEWPLILRNRIIWTFGHGLNSKKRFSGRHEVVLWFSKGNNECFNLDDVRIPQKYPGKKSYKGANKGEYTCNPLGKNPSDVWDIPNVKAKHVEKTIHPCQYPVALPMRLIKALTKPGEIVFDPFAGVGTTGVAAIICGRDFIGSEICKNYYDIGLIRLNEANSGNAAYRKDEPVKSPNPNSSVARMPISFYEYK